MISISSAYYLVWTIEKCSSHLGAWFPYCTLQTKIKEEARKTIDLGNSYMRFHCLLDRSHKLGWNFHIKHSCIEFVPYNTGLILNSIFQHSQNDSTTARILSTLFHQNLEYSALHSGECHLCLCKQINTAWMVFYRHSLPGRTCTRHCSFLDSSESPPGLLSISSSFSNVYIYPGVFCSYIPQQNSRCAFFESSDYMLRFLHW